MLRDIKITYGLIIIVMIPLKLVSGGVIVAQLLIDEALNTCVDDFYRTIILVEIFAHILHRDSINSVRFV